MAVSPFVQRNLDSAQYPQARGSQYEGAFPVVQLDLDLDEQTSRDEHDRSLDEIREAYEELPATLTGVNARVIRHRPHYIATGVALRDCAACH